MAVARLAGTVDFPRVCGGILNNTQTDRPAVSSPLPGQRRLIHLFWYYCLVADEEEDRQSPIVCGLPAAGGRTNCSLSSSRASLRSQTELVQHDSKWPTGLESRRTRRNTSMHKNCFAGLPEPSLHSTRSNTLSPRHPLGEKQLLLPIHVSYILLQVGRLRWTTASQGDSHLQGCIAGASRVLLHAQAHGQALCRVLEL